MTSFGKKKVGRPLGRPKGRKTTLHPFLRRPKQALSAYNIFFKDQKEILFNSGMKGLSFPVLAKHISKLWNNADGSIKDHYNELAKKERIKFQAALKEYYQDVELFRKIDIELSDDNSLESMSTSNKQLLLSSLLSYNERIKGILNVQVSDTQNPCSLTYVRDVKECTV